MKIGILTHYNVSSHGALLQMYALKKTLEDLGHDVCILSYNRNLDFIDEKTRKRFSASFKNLKYYLTDYIKTNGVGALPFQYKKQRVLAGFREGNFRIIPYTDSCDLDCVVIGADEVFSLENGVNIMMYGHCLTSKRVITYAPSFGQTDLARIKRFGCESIISSGLERIDSLSVRDEGSQSVINALSKKNPPIVCDPALLYDFGVKPNERKNYIVVYSYQSNFKSPERIKAIQEYAKKENCELWSVGVYFKWCKKKINCDPLQMIDIFRNARAIITDTYHGTITSFIARTPVAVYVRDNNSVKLDYLLQSIGLEDRKVKKDRPLDAVLSVDESFETVEAKVRNLRAQSRAYLEQALIG